MGHPLGYIIQTSLRYKRLKGYNVLHPMGYDSFGLPTEQYNSDGYTSCKLQQKIIQKDIENN